MCEPELGSGHYILATTHVSMERCRSLPVHACGLLSAVLFEYDPYSSRVTNRAMVNAAVEAV